MRADVIAKLKALSSSTLGTFTVTEELPWESDGVPLYLKNLKRIYVDVQETDLDPIADTLDGSGFAVEASVVSVSFGCDAKTLPANYDSLVTAIRSIRINFGDGWKQRRIQHTAEFDADRLVTTFEFRFERVVTN
jgi:hypothetical protein